MKTIYIAGPMRGYPQFNFPAFDDAAERLLLAGYRVVNPAAIDRACGFYAGDPVTLVDRALLSRFLLRDLAEIVHCQGIALLDGWGASGGVAAECAFGACLDIPAKPLQEWIDEAKTK